MAFDFKKEYKEFYMPKDKPAIISVPKMNYIAVRGKGDPNDENGEYKAAIGLLYGMLERLISAMTREGKFKEAIQSILVLRDSCFLNSFTWNLQLCDLCIYTR